MKNLILLFIFIKQVIPLSWKWGWLHEFSRFWQSRSSSPAQAHNSENIKTELRHCIQDSNFNPWLQGLHTFGEHLFPPFEPQVFYLRSRITGYFSNLRKNSRLEIENKLNQQVILILPTSLVQKCGIPVINTHFRLP